MKDVVTCASTIGPGDFMHVTVILQCQGCYGAVTDKRWTVPGNGDVRARMHIVYRRQEYCCEIR